MNTNIWEAATERRENHVAERGLVPVSAGDVQVQHEHGGAAMTTDGFVRRDQSWYGTTTYLNKLKKCMQLEIIGTVL